MALIVIIQALTKAPFNKGKGEKKLFETSH